MVGVFALQLASLLVMVSLSPGQQESFTAAMQAKLNNKPFALRLERDMHKDAFDNLVGTRYEVEGNTRGSRITWVNADTAEVRLNMAWSYHRTKFRGVQPAINESRNDNGTYVFRVTFDPFTGPVANEVKRESPTVDPEHDSAKTAFEAALEKLFRPWLRFN